MKVVLRRARHFDAIKVQQSGQGDPIGLRHHLGIFFLSFATLLLELSLTRVLSVALWYHLGFFIISTALLGFATSGIVLSIWSWLRERASLDLALTLLSLAFGAAAIASFYAIQHMPFDPFSPNADWGQIFYTPLYFVVLAVPFFSSGLVIALLFTRGTQQLNRLYAADLLGAGAGCASLAVVMPAFGGSGSVAAAAAVGSLAAVCFGIKSARRFSYAGVALGILQLLAAFAGERALPISIASNKEHPLLPGPPRPSPLYTGWNTVSRIDVHELKSSPERGWPGPGFGIVIDGGTAATGMGDLRSGVREHLAKVKNYRPPGLPYIGKKKPKVLIIGSGAGAEVLEALHFKASSITAVEINPIINEIVTKRMRSSWGGLFEQPEVRLITEDGRSFLRRSKETYDVILCVQTVSNSASASGPLSLTEDYLFTLEALEDYIDHLTSDGVILVTRPSGQIERLFATTREVFERRGLGSPAKNLCAVVLPPLPWGSRLAESGFLFKESPWTPKEVKALAERLESYRKRGEAAGPDTPGVLYSPYHPKPGDILHQLMEAPDLRAVYDKYPLVLAPATDDRPYLNHQTQWSSLTRETLKSRDVEGILALLLVQTTVVAALLILLPLVCFSRQGLRVRRCWRFLGYFAGLGLGFILVEIALLQRFTLFLGQPACTFAVVLSSLFIFAGIGSLIGERLRQTPGRVIYWTIPLITVCIAGAAFLTQPIFQASLGLKLPGRLLIAIAMIAPLGILLGIPFPAGLRIASSTAPALIPWAWGISGFFTVLGAIGAVTLGMVLGFKMVFGIAAVSYLGALGALFIGKRERGVEAASGALPQETEMPLSVSVASSGALPP